MNSEYCPGSREVIGMICAAVLPWNFSSVFSDGIAFLGTSLWYTQLASFLICLLFLWMMFHLMKRYPEQTLPEIFQSVLGVFAGKMLGVIFYFYITACTADRLGEAIRLMKAYHFADTPFWIFTAGFLLVSWMICRFGLNGVSKAASLFFLSVLIGIAAALLIGSRHYAFGRLFPLGGYGTVRSLLGTAGGLSIYADLVFLLSAVKPKKKYAPVFYGTLLCGGITVLSFACYLLTFGYSAVTSDMLGVTGIVQNVYFNSLFQRMEAILFLVTVIAVTIGTSVWFYSGLSWYGSVFGFSETKPLMFPHILMIFALTVVTPVQTKAQTRWTAMIFRYSGSVLFILCTLVWIIGIFKQKQAFRKHSASG